MCMHRLNCDINHFVLVLARNSAKYPNLHKSVTWPHFYQTGSAWSLGQGSTKNHSPVNNFAPTVTKFYVMWEGQALPHDTKFRNCRDKTVEGRTVPNWSLIHGSSWSGLIKVGPERCAHAIEIWYGVLCYDIITTEGKHWNTYEHLNSIHCATI